MKNDSFYQLADKSLAGLTEQLVPLGIAHCTVAGMGALITSAKQKRLDYRNAVAGKQQAQQGLRDARSSVDAFIRRARNYLVGIFGQNWSPVWSQVGFVNQSLELPATDAHRASVLELMRSYFTANPGKEAFQLNVSAAEATVQLTGLTTAKSANEACRFDRRDKRNARIEAELLLDKKLRCLWSELESLLDPLDPRWLKFIERIPGDPRVPERVDEVSADVQPGGIIAIDWEDASRAARYKVYKQVVGVDLAPVLFSTVEESDAQITGVPSGSVVKLQIVATNSAGDAAPSAVVQLQAA